MSFNYAKAFKAIEKNKHISNASTYVNMIIDECNNIEPSPDWQYFLDLNYEYESTMLSQHVVSVLTEQPANFEEKGFWFGINNLALNNGNTVANIYFGVSSKYSPLDDNWVFSLEHYPNSRNYNSDIMATIYQLAYSKTNLGNKAEYTLCLAYGLKIAEKSMNFYKKNHPQKRVGYAVGFDSGDFFDMGWV